MIQRLESEIDAANLDDRDHDAIRIVVENNKGEKATAFLSVQMVGGRPRFTLTAKKSHNSETIVRATADWSIMNCDIRDANDAAKFTKLRVRNDAQIGLGVWIEGYSTHTATDDDPDAVFYLEVQDGKPILRVWADINSEEPTHISRRKTTFKGNLYYLDEEEIKHHLASFEWLAVTAADLEREILDQYWDDRLDAASCSPHFEYKIIS